MEKLDANYWTERYLKDDTGWDAKKITTPLKEYVDQLSDNGISILIPGAGNAHELDYLLEKGFKNVYVIDLSEEPLKNIQNRFPDLPASHLIHGDFFEHKGQYDLIIEQTFFCAINPQLRANHAKHMSELLKPKGKLVGVLFNDVLNTDKPPFGGNKQEYIPYFEPYFEFKTFEPCYNSIEPRAGRELFINFVKK